mgnify:CR=1 FL=1
MIDDALTVAAYLERRAELQLQLARLHGPHTPAGMAATAAWQTFTKTAGTLRQLARREEGRAA